MVGAGPRSDSSRARRPFRALVALSAAVVVALLLPASAAAHAVLEDSTPERGAELDGPPETVRFDFNEPVEASFGAVRVVDATGERVDSGELLRPGGSSESIATGIDGELPGGTYTAVYRVISADAHPISGGITFAVGAGGGAAAPSVAELISGAEAGPLTDGAFGAVRGLGYLAIALMVGLPLFAVAVFGPALRRIAGGGDTWLRAAESFNARLRRWLLLAAALGFATSLLAIVLQTAIAAGIGFFDALDTALLREGLDTKFGTVMALRALAFALAGGLVLAPWGFASRPSLRPARLGADGLAPAPALSLPALLALGVPITLLVLSPALAGHPASQDPVAVLVSASALHVAAVSAWLGGVAALLLLVPAATRSLEPVDRSGLLTEVLVRFSPFALAGVGLIVVSGIVQSIVHLEALADLLEGGFGRAILAKALILLALGGFGALNRFVLIPRLRARAAASETPAEAGRLLRRSLIAEVTLMIGALAATAFLSAAPPPSALAAGPQAGSLSMGAADVEWTVDPATPGSNELHIYLFDPQTGAQFEGVRGFEVQLALPSKDLGPIEAETELTGPGHYTVPTAPFGVAGDWEVDLSGRIGRFDALEGSFEVEIG